MYQYLYSQVINTSSLPYSPPDPVCLHYQVTWAPYAITFTSASSSLPRPYQVVATILELRIGKVFTLLSA